MTAMLTRRMGIRLLAAVALLWLASPQVRSDEMAPALTEQQKILHVLNRLGFGPRPGDIERVQKMGLDAYIQEQLHPDQIDDTACEQALAPLDTLKMSSAQLAQAYFDDLRRNLERQKAMANGQDMRPGYGRADANPPATGPSTRPAGLGPMAAQNRMADMAQRDAIRAVGELQEAKLMRAVMSERQLNEVLVDFWTNHFNIDVHKGLCRPLKPIDDREVIRAHMWGKFRDLLGASAHSPAMLFYLDNAQNAVARQRSPAEQRMIDNAMQKQLGPGAKGAIASREGINENYGREIMELHTLGVDGGYTQKDVQEVARCFTGWSIQPRAGEFAFHPFRHDNGEKTVLGHVIPAGGGIKDGEMVLDILAKHPSTAKFISRKLCERFVADEPPPELVDRVASVFSQTDGDLREVVKAIVTSPEFFSRAAYRAKIKSPFEYAVSAVRATGGQITLPTGPRAKMMGVVLGAATIGFGNDRLASQRRKPLDWSVYEMGEPLFGYSAPTGYTEFSSRWVSTGALIDRLNFAMALTEQNVADVHFDPAAPIKGADTDQPRAVLDRLGDSLLHGEMTDATRNTLIKRALPEEGSGETVKVAKLTALMLGSPEFQRR